MHNLLIFALKLWETHSVIQHFLSRMKTYLFNFIVTSGRIYAGHFCYLIAGIPFGSYRNNADKIAAIGSIHAG